MAQLEVEISGDASPLVKEVKKAEKSIDSLGTSGKLVAKGLGSAWSGLTNVVAGLGKAAAAVGAAIAGGLAAGAVKSISLAREQIKVEKQLGAVLKSTGFAARLSADELKALATELSRATNFSKDAVIGAENILLTFTNIGKEAFPEALEATLDLSQALGKDLKSSATLVGKALNDPVKGLASLTDAGIQFSEQQKELVKSLVESGNVAKAQEIIFSELRTQFDNSAKAGADAFIQIQNLLKEVGAEIGKFLLPEIQAIAEAFKGLLTEVPRDLRLLFEIVGETSTGLADKVKGFAQSVEDSGGLVAFALEKIAVGFGFVGGKLREFAPNIAGVVVGFEAIKGAAVVAVLGLKAINDAIVTAGATLLAFVTDKLKVFLEGLTNALSAAAAEIPFAFGGFRDKVLQARDAVKAATTSISNLNKGLNDVKDTSGEALEQTIIDLQETANSSFNLEERFDELKNSLTAIAEESESAADFFARLRDELSKVREEEDKLNRSTQRTNRALSAQELAAKKAAAALAALEAQQKRNQAGVRTSIGNVEGGFVVTSQGFRRVDISTGEITQEAPRVIGSNQTGGLIDRTGTFRLERGEMVLTAADVEALRSGGDTFNFGDINVSAGADSDREMAESLVDEIRRRMSRGRRVSLA